MSVLYIHFEMANNQIYNIVRNDLYCTPPNYVVHDSPRSPRGHGSPISGVSSIMNTPRSPMTPMSPRTPRSPSMIPGGSPQYLLEMSGLQTPPSHQVYPYPDVEFTPSTPLIMAIAANIDVPLDELLPNNVIFQYSPVPFNLPEDSPLESPVPQRVINDDDVCAICHDTMESTCTTMYCMYSCGKSVHEACWTNWQTAQINQGNVPNCVHCRAPWKMCC